MKLFRCDACGQVVYFENSVCLRCGRRLAFLPDAMDMVALDADGDGWRVAKHGAAGNANHAGPPRRLCANAAHDACNWLAPADAAPGAFCVACRHNRTIPDLGCEERLAAWRTIEVVKRRLFYTILRLRLPAPAPGDGHDESLVFDFLADPATGPKVMTGHDSGLITISLAEADPAKREATRVKLGELYRTLLGHFRHEVGHYYWDRLVRDAGDEELARCRALFGDDRADYGAALQRHYDAGAPDDWQVAHVSPYAAMHPWEDWAETWSHYFHIVDTLEMAGAFGVRIDPDVTDGDTMSAEIDFDPHRVRDVQRLLDAWLPLTYAINSLNRAMGQPDVYPFVIGEAVAAKLGYIHGLVRRRGARGLGPG